MALSFSSGALAPSRACSRSGDRVFCGGNSRVCFQVLSLRHVDFLLRDEFGRDFLHVGKARVGEVRDVVGGLRAVEFFVGAREILLAAVDGGLVELKLLLQFGDFQHGEELTLA